MTTAARLEAFRQLDVEKLLASDGAGVGEQERGGAQGVDELLEAVQQHVVERRGAKARRRADQEVNLRDLHPAEREEEEWRREEWARREAERPEPTVAAPDAFFEKNRWLARRMVEDTAWQEGQRKRARKVTEEVGEVVPLEKQPFEQLSTAQQQWRREKKARRHRQEKRERRRLRKKLQLPLAPEELPQKAHAKTRTPSFVAEKFVARAAGRRCLVARASAGDVVRARLMDAGRLVEIKLASKEKGPDGAPPHLRKILVAADCIAEASCRVRARKRGGGRAKATVEMAFRRADATLLQAQQVAVEAEEADVPRSKAAQYWRERKLRRRPAPPVRRWGAWDENPFIDAPSQSDGAEMAGSGSDGGGHEEEGCDLVRVKMAVDAPSSDFAESIATNFVGALQAGGRSGSVA